VVSVSHTPSPLSLYPRCGRWTFDRCRARFLRETSGAGLLPCPRWGGWEVERDGFLSSGFFGCVLFFARKAETRTIYAVLLLFLCPPFSTFPSEVSVVFISLFPYPRLYCLERVSLPLSSLRRHWPFISQTRNQLCLAVFCFGTPGEVRVFSFSLSRFSEFRIIRDVKGLPFPRVRLSSASLPLLSRYVWPLCPG